MSQAWLSEPLERLVEPDSPITYGVVKPGDPGEVPFVRGGDIADGRVLVDQLRTISAEVSHQYKRTLLQGGELLISLVGQPGQVAVAPPELAGSNIARQVGLIRLSHRVLSSFVSYFLRSPDGLAGLGARTGGSVQQVINLSDLRQVLVPVPERQEQQRLVDLLDEAFEGIATAKANVEKNLKNARELFESALDAALSHHGGDFAETTLGDELDLVAGYAFPSKGYTDAANGIRLLRGDNIMQGHLRWDDAKGWPAEDVAPYARFALQQGDVVLAMDRPWVKAGLKRAQIGADDLPCLQLQRTARLRPRRSMSVDFLYHLTGSKSFRRHLLRVQTGLGVPHISGRQIESFRFMLPPPNDQKTIAGRLDDLQQRSEHLEETYQQKVSALEELKKSLLHEAFSGRRLGTQ